MTSVVVNVTQPEPGSVNTDRIRPMNRPIHRPESAPVPSTLPQVRRPVIFSTCIRSTPTMDSFSTGNSLSDSESTAACASA